MNKLRIFLLIFLVLFIPTFIYIASNSVPSKWEMLINESNELKYQFKYDQAIKLAQEAVEVAEKEFGKDTPATVPSLEHLADLYSHNNEDDLRLEVYQRIYGIKEKSNNTNNADFYVLLNNMATIFQDKEQYELAETYFKRAIEIVEDLKLTNTSDHADLLYNLGILYDAQNLLEEALELFNQSLVIHEKVFGKNHFMNLDVMETKSLILIDLNQYEEAESILEDMLTIAKNNESKTIEILYELSYVYHENEKYAKAIECHQKALDYYAKHESFVMLHKESIIGHYYGLGLTSIEIKDLKQAESAFRKVITILENNQIEVETPYLYSIHQLADIQKSQKQYEQAEVTYKKLISVSDEFFVEGEFTAECLEEFADLYKQMKRNNDAQKLEQRATAIRTRLKQEEDTNN